MNTCQKTGNFTRKDITVYTCHCGYYCKSNGGLQQHQENGTNCRDRSLSKTMLPQDMTTLQVSFFIHISNMPPLTYFYVNNIVTNIALSNGLFEYASSNTHSHFDVNTHNLCTTFSQFSQFSMNVSVGRRCPLPRP